MPTEPTNTPTIIAIDPGTRESGVMVLFGRLLGLHAVWPNLDVTCWLEEWNSQIESHLVPDEYLHVVIEEIASYGMPVGRDVFETVRWTGRFQQCMGSLRANVVFIPRIKVKNHLCHTSKAKDANIRQALIDRFGPGKEKAIGNKKNPGPLYGVKSHEWAALALAVTHQDQLNGVMT